MISIESRSTGGKRIAASKSPNFSTRAVKLRLFALVCGVMLVLVLMFEARKPENWAWMGFTEFEPNIDTRYLSNLQESDALQNSVASSNTQAKSPKSNTTESAANSNEANAKVLAATSIQLDEFAKAEKTFWDSIYSKLNYRQRMLLMEGLFLARRGEKLVEEKTSEWVRIAEEVETASDIYQADILKYLNALPESDPQRGSLSNILFRFQNRSKEFLAVFKKIVATSNESEESGQAENADQEFKASLKKLQTVVDRTALGFVQDNALQSFTDDQPAMFRLIDMIQSGEYQLDKESNNELEPVMFAQLYKETERLRGKKVRFTGHIRGAYTSKPVKNYLGLEALNVFWVQISGAQNPVAVYSLSAPKDFVIPLKPLDDSEQPKIREPVEIRGVLFQKMVYAAGDGNRVAPVIFTTLPDWKPKVEIPDSEKELPGLTYLVATFLGIGGTIAFGTWFFVSYNGRRHQKKIDEIKKHYQLDDTESEEANEHKPE